jgi:hypothetical protein
MDRLDVSERQQSNRKRSQWYDDQFAVKPAESTTIERICKDAPVIAELRTNVIVRRPLCAILPQFLTLYRSKMSTLW